MSSKKVLIAMSGGVDSSVAAAEIVKNGYHAVGVHLSLSKDTSKENNRFSTSKKLNGCCSFVDSSDAKRVCDILNIPYYVWNFSKIFKDKVVNNFIDEYKYGRTPNPCMRCNEYIKFTALLSRSLALGFDYLCTGHYALITYDKFNQPQLRRAKDLNKDQSYVLSILSTQQLRHSMFPLGRFKSKLEVRRKAKNLGLINYKKPDSYDICFIGRKKKEDFFKKENMLHRGSIVDKKNNFLGYHNGIVNFTIGQRKGLKINCNNISNNQAKFVVDIQSKSNKVIVGNKKDLKVNEIYASNFKPCGESLDLIKNFFVLSKNKIKNIFSKHFLCSVQFRSHGQSFSSKCVIKWDFVKKQYFILVNLDNSIDSGISPGQSIVLYKNTRVLGRAIVDSTRYKKKSL